MNTTTLPTSCTYDRLATLTLKGQPVTMELLTGWIKRDIKAKLAHRGYRLLGTAGDFARMMGGTRKMK